MKLIGIACALLTLTACSSVKPSAYETHEPKLVLEDFFSKNLEGRGAFFGRSGDLGTRFTMTSSGKWDGKMLTMDEKLKYESGEEHERTYFITKIDEHHYEVKADELVGKGLIESYGSALRWTYTLAENSKQARGIALTFDDWMYLSPDGFIIDRAEASKFGVGVGEIFISIAPQAN